jgi:hypothetical protein
MARTSDPTVKILALIRAAWYRHSNAEVLELCPASLLLSPCDSCQRQLFRYAAFAPADFCADCGSAYGRARQ